VNGEEGWVFTIGHKSVVFQLVCLDKQVFAMIKYSFEFKEVMFIWVTISINVSQYFYLI
jgi:hypothetical protein